MPRGQGLAIITAMFLSSLPLAAQNRSQNSKSQHPLQVVSVTATARPANWNGKCPHEFHFQGIIQAQGSGDVQYVWERSDHASSSGTLHFTGPAGKSVTDIWQLSSPPNATYHGWERLRMTGGGHESSSPASFTVHCSK